jgi:cell division protein FtsB
MMSAVWRVLMVLLPSLIIATALFSVPALVFSDRGLPRLRALQQRLEETEEQNEALARDNELLTRRIQAIREDPRQVEWIARRELGLVRPDELVFHF